SLKLPSRALPVIEANRSFDSASAATCLRSEQKAAGASCASAAAADRTSAAPDIIDRRILNAPMRSAAAARPLQHAFERQTRAGPQLHLVSGQPDIIAPAARLLAAIETELVLVNAPFSDALASHGIAREDAVTLEDVAPMHAVAEFHSGELGADLRAAELLELLGGRRSPRERQSAEHRPRYDRERSVHTGHSPSCDRARIARARSEPLRRRQFVARAVLSSAARRPLASFNASSFAQKCMKIKRGCSDSMWLCTAVTSMPFVRSALITGFTSSAVRTKSPVMAALPPPVGWKLMPVASPIGPAGAICMPFSLTASRRGTPNA